MSPRGRPKKDTAYIRANIPQAYFTRIIQEYPEFFKPGGDLMIEPVWKHGAASRFITSLLSKHFANLDRERNRNQDRERKNA